ncbi:MAG: cytidylate kinase-like family protein [Magnetococcales bacterium]|nr:cytidylate kinase-like family protein [Magnetococcales bacterium]
MAKLPLKHIQSIVGAQLHEGVKGATKEGPGSAPPLVVTVSRSFGAGGTDIAAMLAERLGVFLYDRELLKAIVKETKADKHLLERLDERATSFLDDIVLSFFSKKSTSKDNFYRYMVKVILGISHSGGVIVGRGAHLVIPKDRKAFRLRLEASLEAATNRVAKRLDIKKRKARELVLEQNLQREQFITDILERYPTDRREHDLTINTDGFTPEQVVNIVVCAMKQAGFEVPKK